MDDLERLYRGLVQVIRETNPDRLHSPFQVSELYQSILPYRTNRSWLGFDSSEDYDMAVLKLLAGHRHYASVEPAEVMEQLALEAESINPTPGFYRDFAAARVTLNAAALAALNVDATAYAPPDLKVGFEANARPEELYGPTGQPGQDASRRLVFEAVESESEANAAVPSTDLGANCRSCARPMPCGRRVQYCPFCGTRVGSGLCSTCGDVMERGWKYCITCGEPSRTG